MLCSSTNNCANGLLLIVDWKPSYTLKQGLEKTYKWIYEQMTTGKSTLQDGFQEVDICAQVKNVTKYAKTITNKSDIPLELEKAYSLSLIHI